MAVRDVLTVVQILLSLAVLLVALGRWGGKLEARGAKTPSPNGQQPSGTNGQPSFGELVRRLEKVEDDRRAHVRRRDLEETLRLRDDSQRRERDEVWSAIKGLREADTAITRRVDGLMGQG
jgi:hypothetical protein